MTTKKKLGTATAAATAAATEAVTLPTGKGKLIKTKMPAATTKPKAEKKTTGSTAWAPRSNKRTKNLTIKKGQKFYSFRKAAEMLKTTHQTLGKYANDLRMILAYEERHNTTENKFMLTADQIKELKEHAKTIKRGRPVEKSSVAKKIKKTITKLPTPKKKTVVKGKAKTKKR